MQIIAPTARTQWPLTCLFSPFTTITALSWSVPRIPRYPQGGIIGEVDGLKGSLSFGWRTGPRVEAWGDGEYGMRGDRP